MVDKFDVKAAQAHQQAGRLAEAEGIYRTILASEPDNAEAWHYLGVAAYQQGRHDEARQAIGRSLELAPRNADALSHLALVEHAAGVPARALSLLREAMAIDPDHRGTLINLGAIALACGDGEEAIAAFSRNAHVYPSPDAQAALAIALRKLGRLEEATGVAERLVRASADYPLGLDLLALLRRDAGRIEESIALHRQALADAPQFAGGWNNLANTLVKAGQIDEAIAGFRRALALKPDFAEAWLNLARSLLAAGRAKEALEACGHYTSRAAATLDALCIQGDAARALGDFDAAIASYRAAIDKDLDDRGAALGRLCETLLATCRWQDLAPVHERALELARSGRAQRIPPFQFLRLSDDPALQYRAARDFSAEREKEAKANGPTFTGTPARRGRLRIGYLSADFRDHAIAQLLVEVIEKHDRGTVETFGYSLGPGDASALRRRLMLGFEHFVDLGRTPARAAAQKIHQDGIDILIDLMGYTEGARPDLLALRPAPIQAAYLGYPGTSGARFVDYAIADSVAIPPGADSNFSEAIVRLARCYQPADSRLEVAASASSRAEEGLPEQGVVFCCFNNGFKLAPQTFDLWLDLLGSCPGSVLWLLQSNAVLPGQLRQRARSRGIAGERLVFARRVDRALHLARHPLADLFLDTSPYGAHTTASDALRLAVPVVTAPGATFASRVAASLLHHLGLGELIAADMAGYRAIALSLAGNPARGQAMRARIVERLSSTAWLDAGDHARQLEAAYRRMWDDRMAGRPPVSFSL